MPKILCSLNSKRRLELLELRNSTTKFFGETASLTHPFRSLHHFLAAFPLPVLEQLLCDVHAFIPIHSRALASPQGALHSVLVSVWHKVCLSSPCLDPSPPRSLSFSVQDNLRQLIMIPLPNVLLLGRTPYCGELF